MSKVEYQVINFGPFLMKTKCPKHIQERLLIDGKKELKSYNNNLAGHLKDQFVYNKDTMMWFYKETKMIWDAYRTGHCNFHNIEQSKLELDAHNIWINFMKPGDFNPLHTHSGDFSFVIFLETPKGLKKEQKEYEGSGSLPGSLMFEFTQNARPKWATTGVSVIPEVGDMYIFPAMLRHWVCPFKSKGTRISVSGNLSKINDCF